MNILRSLLIHLVLVISLLGQAQLYGVEQEIDLTRGSTTTTVESIIFNDDLGATLDGTKFESLLSLTPGTIFEIDLLMADLESLKKGLADKYPSIEMNIVPLKEGSLEIHYELQKNRVINRVTISAGDLNPTDLREKLKAIKGTYLKSTIVNSDESTVLDYFHNRGYPFATAKSKVTLSKDNKNVDITYAVELNSKELKTRKISFSGVTAFEAKKIRSVMRTKAKSIFGSNTISKEKLKQDVQAIESLYKNDGYINAKVKFKVTKDSKKDKYANVEFIVSEGKQLLVNEVEIVGNQIYSTESILKALDFDTPTPFNLSDQKKALQRVRDIYGESGYALSQVQMRYDDVKQSIVIDVIEGLQQKVMLIEVVGNSKTKKKTILEELKIERGELVDSKKVKSSIEALYKMGNFKDVRVDYVPMTSFEGKIVVQVVENSTRVIQFSLGSVYGSAGIGASISEGNIFGTGASVSFSAMISKELSRLNLIYNDPHLLGSDYQLTASINHDSESSFHFNARRTAIKLMIKKQITKNLKLGLGTRLEYVSPEDISNDYIGTVDLSNNKDVITGLISSFGYTIDQKDEDGNVQSQGKISMILMPSYVDQQYFFKAMTNLSAFRNLGTNYQGGTHQISGRITLGYATEEAPFYEKFRGGGHGTIRGFEHGSIVGEDGELGAGSSLSANVTYSFPLYENALSGVVFLDAFTLGNSAMNFGDVRLVGGFGMRANLNTGLINDSIEAGIAIPLLRRDGDITRPFYFIFGDYDPAYSL